MLLETTLLAVVCGTLLSVAIALLPGLHVYNAMGLMALLLTANPKIMNPDWIFPFSIGLVCGWSILNTLSAVLLSAPDESALFTVLPGQKYLMQGRGYEGVMIFGLGGLLGTLFLLLLAPFAPHFLALLQSVFQPYMHGIIWVVITFLLMSEWPKGGRLGNSGWKRFWDAWKGLCVGLLTFLLSGLLGFILLYRSPISAGASFQNIMPAFVGLFAVPSCLLNMVSKQPLPKQQETQLLKLTPRHLFHGLFSGLLGGGFAAFFPVITGGIGGLLAGHATAQRDERIFMLAQGTSKTIYYTGGLLLFFMPNLHLTRGGGAWILRGLLPSPDGHSTYLMALGCIAISGGLAFLLLAPLARLLLRIMQHIPVQIFSATTLLLVGIMIYFVTSWSGIFILLVASGIGFLPLLYGARRINALGLLLLPMACNMSGFGSSVAQFLGLL